MLFNITIKLQKVDLKKSYFDLSSGLMKSSLLPWVPVSIDSTIVREEIMSEVPIDGTEVVEWMLYCASDNAVFDGMASEYNRLGSELVSGSGDAYIPGVQVGSLRGISVNGSVVMSKGYGEVYTPRGSFRIPVGGKATFAMGDILAWGAIPYCGTVQWSLTLLQWKDLAKAPVKNRVRFAASNGLVAPNFFTIPQTFSPIRTLRIGLTSDKQQKVVIKGRGNKGSFENILFEDSFEVDAGESEVIYNVIGFPFVSSFTLELQPSDNTQTVLDYIEILPPW
ncbi:MAG: hypothetical protein QXN17_03795 [Nitrososphaerota archaeon]